MFSLVRQQMTALLALFRSRDHGGDGFVTYKDFVSSLACCGSLRNLEKEQIESLWRAGGGADVSKNHTLGALNWDDGDRLLRYIDFALKLQPVVKRIRRASTPGAPISKVRATSKVDEGLPKRAMGYS